jgi:hypothetical protein
MIEAEAVVRDVYRYDLVTQILAENLPCPLGRARRRE